MIFAMPNKPGEFSRFDFPEVLPAPLNGKLFLFYHRKSRWVCLDLEKSFSAIRLSLFCLFIGFML